MAPLNTARNLRSGPSTEDSATPANDSPSPADVITNQQAEIDRLSALLAAVQDENRTRDAGETPAWVETLVRAMRQSSPPPTKTNKFPDPPVLTDGQDPSFEGWMAQIQDKLLVNADQFSSERAQMAYVFSRTSGGALKHLQPRYRNDAAQPFQTANEMIQYLSRIYQDPDRVDKARREYRRLYMKASDSFNDFYTRFLHLAGEGQILEENLQDDLWEKVSLDIQTSLIGVKRTLTTLDAVKEACQSADNDLRRIKDLRTRTRTGPTASPRVGTGGAERAPSKPSTPTASRQGTPAPNGRPADRPRPVYDDPKTQALSNQGACFLCHEIGHFARDCTAKRAHVAEVQEEPSYEEQGKEQP